MEKKICQSCGMALGDPGFYGTNSDDSRNEQCAEMYAMNSGGDAAAVEAARTHMTELFPTLKRWKK